jgi:uncharacterized protein YndB with AHSA1/START domain
VKTSDSIERKLVLPAPPAQVWTALTRSEQLCVWFGTEASIDVRPGRGVIFTRDGSTHPRGANSGVIRPIEPPNRFAFRRQSSPGSEQMTQVDCTLEPDPESARLRINKSDVARLPPELLSDCHESCVGGWQRKSGKLAPYLAVR